MEILRDFVDKVQSNERRKDTSSYSNTMNCGTSEARKDHWKENFREPTGLERFAEKNRFEIRNSLKKGKSMKKKINRDFIKLSFDFISYLTEL